MSDIISRIALLIKSQCQLRCFVEKCAGAVLVVKDSTGIKVPNLVNSLLMQIMNGSTLKDLIED